MKRHTFLRSLLAPALGLAVALAAGGPAVAQSPLAIESGKLTIAGNSNVHAWTAATTKIRVTKARIAPAATGAEFWDAALKPGGVEAFEIAIPAASLSAPKGDLDKNMHKALKVTEHADITFALLRFEPTTGGAGTRAIGVLRIAGVEKEVALDITAKRAGSTLAVTGRVDLLMTDYGIAPPKAMLGMLKTDPKVTIAFETVLAIPLT
jgi:polyisoprenoid-binding protein YceI